MFKLSALLTICYISQAITIDVAVNKQACIRDADVNPSLVERAYHGQITNLRELQCYFKCYYENAGYINSKGEIQEDKLRENIPVGVNKGVANKAIDVCKDRKGKDACETAYLTQKCLLDNNIKF